MTEQQLQEINCYLREQCGWELEVGISPHDTSEFFRVYRLQKNGFGKYEKVFMAAMPIGTPVGVLACSASLCKHYYQLGLGYSVQPK